MRGIPCVFRDDFEIVTAVMAGDNHLELRLFSPEGVNIFTPPDMQFLLEAQKKSFNPEKESFYRY